MKVCIIGSGGHGRVISDTVIRNVEMDFVGFIDDKSVGQVINSHRVIGSMDDVDRIVKNYDDLRFVIGVGDNNIRREIARKLINVKFTNVIDPSAIISGSVRIGTGTVVMPNVVVNSQAVIGSHVVLNTSCSVDHDSIIEDFSHILPGVHISGTVKVGEGTHMGTGVTVIPGVVIGQWCKIGAGSVVVRNIEDNVVAYGVPARVHRKFFP